MFLLRIALYDYYGNDHPRLPQPETGFIYALNNHGKIVCLTWDEHLLMQLLWHGSIVAGGLGFVLYLRNKRRHQRMDGA